VLHLSWVSNATASFCRRLAYNQFPTKGPSVGGRHSPTKSPSGTPETTPNTTNSAARMHISQQTESDAGRGQSGQDRTQD
jgi:hypothetical protein